MMLAWSRRLLGEPRLFCSGMMFRHPMQATRAECGVNGLGWRVTMVCHDDAATCDAGCCRCRDCRARRQRAGWWRAAFAGIVAAVALLSLWSSPGFAVERGGKSDNGQDGARPGPSRGPDRSVRRRRGPILDVEATYYRQGELLERAIGALAPSPKDRPQVYFVGLAAYSGQDVFLREASQARDLFDARFGTRGRSLLFANHHSTVTTLPLANASNLERALLRLGRIMDVDKDVLVLFVTTHGTEGLLAVSFPRFSFNDLTPAMLKRMLDASRIKYRVVVLSACHSGSFIPALRDRNTLVLTASRADRTSFGCSNERYWTYFGDAFFNRSLRQTHSLPEAFERAKKLISGWERKERLQPSEPQRGGGEALGPRLDAIARRLARGAPAQDGPTRRKSVILR
ncbi:MAG: C13 family peptidase [Hyphomicrobiaceae bacterium]